MSNNPTPPRIEREARKYATSQADVNSRQDCSYCIPDYLKGAEREFNRAAPVVKALEKMYKDYHEFMTYKERMDLKQILQTYKADV